MNPRQLDFTSRTVCAISLLCGALYGLAFPLAYAAHWGVRRGYWVYDAAQAAVSYFDTGFARRELEGTILRPFHAEPMVAALAFHLVTVALLTLAIMVAVCRASQPIAVRVSLAAVLAAMLARLGLDVGRQDAAVMLCGMVAVWGVTRSRWLVAAIALSVALLFHESGLIVLAPLVLASAWVSGAWRSWRWTSPNSACAAGVLVAALLAYGISLHPVRNLPAVALQVHGAFVDPQWADFATFANLTGSRGLAASVCNNMANPAYALRVLAGLLVCAMLIAAFQRRRPVMAAVMIVGPYLFLSAISTDIGRWANFAAFAAVMMALVEQRRPDHQEGVRTLALGLAAAAVMVVSLDYRSVVFAPVPAADAFAQDHGFRSPDPIDAVTACDRTWRRAIGLAP